MGIGSSSEPLGRDVTVAIRQAVERIVQLWDDTVAPPTIGLPPTLQRLLRMRWRSAVVLAAPALLLIAWYLWQAVLSHARTVAGTGEAVALDAETLQLNLHDLLSRDLRRAFKSDDNAPQANLPTLRLTLDNASLDGLDRQLPPPPDGQAEYVPGALTFQGLRYEVDLRYRGSKHWHWNYPQKSLKIRFRKPGHLLSHETLLLLNSPEPEPLLELAILGIAERRGLMVPRFAPVRLVINENQMGLYFLEAPADEATIRYHRRLPWNLYSGDSGPLDPTTGVSKLFETPSAWNKAASPLEDKTGLVELQVLLDRLGHATPEEFEAFAKERLDLEAFAVLDAIDVVFGLDQRNYDENQKLYFDPYRGRFEPVVWNVRGADHDAALHRAMSPLTQRLEELPTWTKRRNRLVMELLEGEASPAALSRSLEHWDQLLAGAFEQDRFWDAVDLLPPAGPYFRDMVRPMTRGRQLQARELLQHRLEERGQWLTAQLSGTQLEATLVALPTSDAATSQPQYSYRLSVRAQGLAAFELERLRLLSKGECPAQQSSLFRGLSGQGLALTMAKEVLNLRESLSPGTVRIARPPHRARGAVELATQARDYDYLLRTACPLEAVELGGHQAATLAAVSQTVALTSETSPVVEPPCPNVFEAGPGGRSAHPWCHQTEVPKELVLGPGVVRLDNTVRISEDTTVTVRPGTTFEMGPQVSFLVSGKLVAKGTAQEPIRWQGTGWGVLALQGRGTAGSVLEHVTLRGGSSLQDALTHYSAMLSVHDTEAITLADVTVTGARGGDDAVHFAYVRGLELSRIFIADSASDSIDLEFCEGKIQGLTALASGDDAVDVMGSKLQLMGLVLLGCKDNGVSAGEQSDLTLKDLLVVGCPTGMLAKNSSTLRLDGAIVVKAERGLRVEQLSEWYGQESQALGTGLWLQAVTHPISVEGKPVVELVALQQPDARAASILATLGAPSWEGLMPWAAERLQQVGR
jgi:hypothetical protein